MLEYRRPSTMPTTLRQRTYKYIFFSILVFAVLFIGKHQYGQDSSNWKLPGYWCDSVSCPEQDLSKEENPAGFPTDNKESKGISATSVPELPSANGDDKNINDGHGGVDNNDNDYGTNDTLHSEPISDDHKEEYPFTIVTAASFNHFCVLQSWLYYTNESLKNLDPQNVPRIIVYDLGLAKYQMNLLNYLKDKGYLTELRTFDYSAYPNFWNISDERGQYAWKAGIVKEVTRDYPGIVMWLDSGSIVSEGLVQSMPMLLDSFDGFVSPRSLGRIPAWTHPGVFKYFNEDPRKFERFRNCNGAMLLFDSRITQPLIDAWYECALVKECIAPEGSNRSNHRQDQAILSLLAAKEGRECRYLPKYFGIGMHQDYACLNRISEYESSHPDVRWKPTEEDLLDFKEFRDTHTVTRLYDITINSEENI